MKEAVRSLLAAFRQPALRGLLLGLACALVTWWLTRSSLMRGLDDWLQDGWFSSRGTRPTQARVVLIGLDEDSLNDIPKPFVDISPELGEVVAYAADQKAAAIGLDLMVPEGLSGSPHLDIDQPGDASKLGQAVADAGNVVLPQGESQGRWVRPVKQWQFKYLTDPSPKGTDFGFVDLTEDDDFFVRRQKLTAQAGNQPSMHFALALYAVATGAEVEGRDGALWVGGRPLPLDAEKKLPINFVGPPGSFPVVPFREVLADARAGVARPAWSGAVVILGVTARDQRDYEQVPYSHLPFRSRTGPAPGLMAGPEIHAHILATLVDRAFITTPWWLSPLPLLLTTGMILGILYTRLNLEWGAVLAVAYFFGWQALSEAAFSRANWRLEMVGMFLLGFLTYGVTFGLRWRKLRHMFGVTQSEAIAKALETDPTKFDLWGEERTVTVLFADIRNFTPFSESHSPHEVLALLNAYFTAIVPLIEEHGGTLNHYLGDGLMVIYGAPLLRPDHAVRAVRTAVAVVHRVHELKDLWARLGNPGMRIGIGVHTGRVVVGAVGSPRRLDYSAIGDTVNAAARIEDENKRLHTEILISAATYQALSADERVALPCSEQAELVMIKGKKECMHLHPVQVT